MTENFPRSEIFLLSLHWPGKFMLIFIIINMRLVNLSTLLFENMGQFANLKKRYPKCGVGCKKLGLDFLIILKKKRGQAASSLFEYQKNFQTLFFATCFLQPVLFTLYFEPYIFKVPDHKKYQIDLIN